MIRRALDYSLLEVSHDILWKKPALLIEGYKEVLRDRGELMVQRIAESPISIRISMPVRLGEGPAVHSDGPGSLKAALEREASFHICVYGDKTTGEEHIAMVKGLGNGEDVPLRVHSSCVTAEVFHASNCDCHEQLEAALDLVDRQRFGMVIWLHQEGRGNGLAAKVKQLRLMMLEGLDTVAAFEKAGYPADQRDYSVAADMLKDLGVRSVRLITNNPDKVQQLSYLGIIVNGRIPCEIESANEVVRKDLRVKKDRLGHYLEQEL